MSKTRDVTKMVHEEANRLALRVERVDSGWAVTSVHHPTGRVHVVPYRLGGSEFYNQRAQMRRLAREADQHVLSKLVPVMAAAAAGRDSVETLVEGARADGIQVYVAGGMLNVAGPLDVLPGWRDLLMAREQEVINHLAPPRGAEPADQSADQPDPQPDPAPEPEADPSIGDDIHVRDITEDAELLYRRLLDEAKKQGLAPQKQFGVLGLVWKGALKHFVATEAPSWANDYMREVAEYLKNTRHIRNLSHGHHTKWWIAPAWSSDLIVVRPKPPADGQDTQEQLPIASAVALDRVKGLADRLATAEKSAARAERLSAALVAERKKSAELAAELRETRGLLDGARAELAEWKVVEDGLKKLGLA
ncbi:hypothetical protein ACIBH1_45350 [Nonomuraea sp. NPDC050663]|uniref:hypothetical protein n=1 Tax=Nonomuraea sp. NPDC050663 TaxID=3364370 RepID=UPI0037B4B5DD